MVQIKDLYSWCRLTPSRSTTMFKCLNFTFLVTSMKLKLHTRKCYKYNKTIVDCISPAPTLDLVTRGAAPGHTGSYSSFLYKLCKIYFFCEIEKVSRCVKYNVLLLKLKTKSHKTIKRKHVIILITIEGLPDKLKL